jgi:hypothetical protein
MYIVDEIHMYYLKIILPIFYTAVSYRLRRAGYRRATTVNRLETTESDERHWTRPESVTNEQSAARQAARGRTHTSTHSHAHTRD